MKKVLLLILTVLMLMALIACRAPETVQPAESNDVASEAPVTTNDVAEAPAATEEPETFKLVLSIHDPTIPWVQPMKAACDDVAKEFGVEVLFTGPTPSDAVKQLEQIKTLVEQGQVDGLAIAPLDDQTLRPYIDELVDKEIPVVTLTTDSPESKRLAFYGQGHESLETIAYDLSKKTIELLGPNPTGKVAILNCLPDLESLIMRENGTKRALEEYPGLENLGTYAAKTDFAACYADVEALMTANPDIVALFAEDSYTTPSAAKVLRDLNIKDKVKLSGYDMTEEALLLVKDGYLDILVGQNPYAQAYYSVKALCEYLMDGTAPQTLEVEAEYATPENIGEFLRVYNVE